MPFTETLQATSFSQEYSYDLADRLSTVMRDGALVSEYGFDSNSNRTSHSIGVASPLRGRTWPCLGDLGIAEVEISASYDAQDRMSSYGSCGFTYNQNGELTQRLDNATGFATHYSYDVFSNLRQVTLADGRVIDYAIDALNRRVGKSIDGVRQHGWLYANDLEPIAELDAAGNVIASFLYAERGHVPSLMLKGGNAYRIVSDHLGSVRLVINTDSGVIAQRLSYDEYGNVTEDTNPGFQPFGYAGGLYDPDTGLVRFGARDYDALTGRWTSKDPIGFEGGDVNLYTYVASDPISYIDRSGLIVETVWDIGNVIYDIWNEEWGDAAADAAAMCLPGVPAGLTKLKRLKKLEPIPDAAGPHTVWKTDPGGKITRHETWEPNSRNPTGWESVQSTDMTGNPHYNKNTGTYIPTPHTQGRGIPGGVRPATPNEIPRQ